MSYMDLHKLETDLVSVRLLVAATYAVGGLIQVVQAHVAESDSEADD